ncbi:N-acetylmuramic acid 6-phosphate etherase [Crossiella cryophila]|uniref:N-acetylmuramic acid 6-phosphate etherase n=1 Tax=Crossiella cryophila TaxID=43355 RepID=A0A7W7C8P0_9PSEU|nr:N-acetylmuramic acid 6-phosphate etherase [Crossiella cryophila]MBB4675244.1 N-acetylmuramic acid 6-phosphate etherase [Crossiella cryophila]
MSFPTPRPSVRVDSPTERRNPRTLELDQLPTEDMLRMINAEDQLVPGAVALVLPELARAVDFAVESLRSGGRVHYVGAGTSGRLATLDAAELVPTFSAPTDWFLAHHAGGAAALRQAVEDAEDSLEAGAAVIAEHASPKDFVLGLAASGRTPFVLSALAAARRLGARTGLVSANPAAIAGVDVDVRLAVDTGPEAIAGSTRMKAGTAQKLVLTSFSTAVMVRLGRTYSNLMVSMKATNAKLRGRSLVILGEATGLDEKTCSAALLAAEGDVKTALVCLLSGVDTETATRALEASSGHVRHAMDSLRAATG